MGGSPTRWNTLQGRLADPGILRNAAKVSLFVGTLLNLFNQGPQILAGQGIQVGRALLNHLVPFCVAVYSGVKARAAVDPSAQGHVQGGDPDKTGVGQRPGPSQRLRDRP